MHRKSEVSVAVDGARAEGCKCAHLGWTTVPVAEAALSQKHTVK